jgi:hypothetical protein
MAARRAVRYRNEGLTTALRSFALAGFTVSKAGHEYLDFCGIAVFVEISTGNSSTTDYISGTVITYTPD